MSNELYPIGPFSFYKNESVTRVWIGDQIFLAERTYQKQWKQGDWEGNLPVPDWDDWLAHGRPKSYAEYQPTSTMFTLWQEPNPYKFAVNAVNSYWIPDAQISNEFDLQNWMVRNDVRLGDVLFGRSMLSRFTDILPLAFNFKNYAGWCRWGGVYVQNPEPLYMQ